MVDGRWSMVDGRWSKNISAGCLFQPLSIVYHQSSILYHLSASYPPSIYYPPTIHPPRLHSTPFLPITRHPDSCSNVDASLAEKCGCRNRAGGVRVFKTQRSRPAIPPFERPGGTLNTAPTSFNSIANARF
jgi:hypothetical protein